MPVNPDAVGNVGPQTEISWDSKDSMLYALGVGAGATDPTGFKLGYTTENSQNTSQRALPTQVVVMGAGGVDFGDFDLAALLHGEQSITLHQTLPAAGSAVGTSRVAAIYDKGKAALVVLDTDVTDLDGNPLWTSTAGLFIAAEGGWGGDRGPSSRWVLPDREADHTVGYNTRTDQALLHALCASDSACFGSMTGRFKSPVIPGERLDVHMWDTDGRTLFQTRVGNRVVFDAGVFTHQ